MNMILPWINFKNVKKNSLLSSFVQKCFFSKLKPIFFTINSLIIIIKMLFYYYLNI